MDGDDCIHIGNETVQTFLVWELENFFLPRFADRSSSILKISHENLSYTKIFLILLAL